MALSGQERMRRYRERQAARVADSASATLAALPAGNGEVESAVMVELQQLGSVLTTLPGVCATAIALARMLDREGERSAQVGAQLRMTLTDLRQAAQSASGSGRLAGLRSAADRQRGA